MAKRFFFVCAGLFLLALSYHLGAQNATAQSGGNVQDLGDYYGNPMVATPNGDVFSATLGCGNCPPWESRGNVFGASPGGRTVVALDNRSALASSGEVFWLGSDGIWHNLGVPSGPTPAQQESWGALKSRYRGERGAARPAPHGR